MTIPVPVPVSQFPDATIPLTGSELVPLVQGGITKKTTASTFAVFATLLLPEIFRAIPAGNSNNVSAKGALRLFLDTAAGDATVTGFYPTDDPLVLWRDGQILIVANSGGANALTLAVGIGSIPANQIYGVTDITLPPHGSQMLVYSGTLQKLVMV